MKPTAMTPHIQIKYSAFLTPAISSNTFYQPYKSTLLRNVRLLTRLNNMRFSKCVHTVIEAADWIGQHEIEQVLSDVEVPFENRYTGVITTCQRCASSTSSSTESCLSLFIDYKTGRCTCRVCGCKYDWKTFKKDINKCHQNKTDAIDEPLQFDVRHVGEAVHEEWRDSVDISDVDRNSLLTVFPSIAVVEEGVFQRYAVRSRNSCLCFPFFDITKRKLISCKTFAAESEASTVLIDSGEHSSLFGWNTIEDDHTKVILTTNEFDCLSVFQATGTPTLCLPFGASTLSPDCFPYLEQFDEIILWFRSEYQARQNLQRFARKLDLSRCSFVTSDRNPADVLRHEGCEAIEKILLGRSLPMSNKHIITFKELSHEVFSDLIHAKRNAGIPFVRFPALNEYLKGHRRGELTIFTGPTGSGKTTFLSELSLDLCLQGVRTLWGSFEIKNTRLANTMLHQLSGIALENYLDRFNYWNEEFENLPMYFMNYYGTTELRYVLHTIRYAVYTYDIEHVIIDNLQFMTSIERGEDRFQLLDKAIAAFRQCASNHNIHVTVVVHPRKENDGSQLQTSSIYGSAKASQEADNVLILQKCDKVSMQVSKNRYSGAVGTIPLSFHPDSLCLSGFHRNVATNEGILPALKVKRPVQNIKILRKAVSSNE